MRCAILLAVGFLLAADIHAEEPKPRLDAEGFPLPAEAVRRLGSAKFLAGTVEWAAFSPDNKTLLTFDTSSMAGNLMTPRRGMMAWELTTGKCLWECPLEMYRCKLAIDPDGKSVHAVGIEYVKQLNGNSHPILFQYRVELSSGKLLSDRKVSAEKCDCFDVAPDGSVFRVEIRNGFTPEAYGTDKEGKQTFYCDSNEHLGTVRTLKRSVDGKRLYVGLTGLLEPLERETNYVVAFDVPKGTRLWKHRVETLVNLEVSADGKCVYALEIVRKNTHPWGPTTVYELDADTGEKLRKVEFKDLPYQFAAENLTHPVLARHPDGKRLWIAGRFGSSTPLDLKTFELGAPQKHDLGIGWYSPDAAYFAGRAGGQIIVSETKTTKPIAASPPPFALTFSGTQRELLWDSTGTRIAKMLSKQAVEWETATGKETFRGERLHSKSDLTGVGSSFAGFSWNDGAIQSPDGRYTAKFTQIDAKNTPSRGVWVFTDLRKPDAKIVIEDVGRTGKYQFSPDGRTFADGGNGAIKFWDLTTGGKPRVLDYSKNVTGRGSGVSWQLSPTGSTLAVHVDNSFSMDARQDEPPPQFRLLVYDVATLERIATVQGVPRLFQFTWSLDGKRLAGVGKTGRFENTGPFVFVSDMATEAMPIPVTTLDHPAGVIALSPDGRTLAVSTLDDIRLYEVATRKLRHTFKGFKSPPTALHFSPDGRYLASDSADGPVLLWDVRGELLTHNKPASFDALWPTLRGGTATEGFEAIRLMAAFPDAAVPMLKAKLAAEPKPDAVAIGNWIADLGGKDFAAREKADRELRNIGTPAKLALRAALMGEFTAEFRQRAEAILGTAMEPDRLRAIRAVEILNWIGSLDAKKLLAEWAAGAKSSPWTVEAKRALK